MPNTRTVQLSPFIPFSTETYLASSLPPEIYQDASKEKTYFVGNTHVEYSANIFLCPELYNFCPVLIELIILENHSDCAQGYFVFSLSARQMERYPQQLASKTEPRSTETRK
jgi:hypothetical protein